MKKTLLQTERISAILENDILTVTFSNPSMRNAFDKQMSADAIELKKRIIEDGTARVIVFTGAGDVFSAGGDLNLLARLTEQSIEENHDFMYGFYRSFLDLTLLPQPSIAMINGHAVGAGLCFALSCDLRFISDSAKIGLNFVKIGINPGMGAEYFLKRSLPSHLAAEMLYTGQIYRVSEMKEYSLFNGIFPAGQLTETVYENASAIAANSPAAVGHCAAILRSMPVELDAVLQKEAAAQGRCLSEGQVLEAITAQREKRPFYFDI